MREIRFWGTCSNEGRSQGCADGVAWSIRSEDRGRRKTFGEAARATRPRKNELSGSCRDFSSHFRFLSHCGSETRSDNWEVWGVCRSYLVD